LRRERPKPLERGRRDEVNGCAVEERTLRQVELEGTACALARRSSGEISRTRQATAVSPSAT
jgi:hypothetical protein